MLDAGGWLALREIEWRSKITGETFFFRLLFRRSADLREGRGLHECKREWAGGGWSCGILRNLIDYAAAENIETCGLRISYGDVKGAQYESCAGDIDLVANDGVDDLHERGLDGRSVLNQRDGMEPRFGRGAHAANHALVKVAENFFAKSGRAAAGSVDLDVSAETNVVVACH